MHSEDISTHVKNEAGMCYKYQSSTPHYCGEYHKQFACLTKAGIPLHKAPTSDIVKVMSHRAVISVFTINSSFISLYGKSLLFILQMLGALQLLQGSHAHPIW